jgi:threonine synthase
MYACALKCVECGLEVDVGAYFLGCQRCAQAGTAGALCVAYDEDAARIAFTRGFRQLGGSIWRFAGLLPVRDASVAITLGEGATPLLHMPRSPENPLDRLYVKVETTNPTWAFKDRFHAVSLSVARELGFDRVVASSTGNHGVSMAAYAAAGGLSSTVIVDPDTSALQVELMRLFGARIRLMKQRTAPLRSMVVDQGWYPSTYVTPMPVATPYGIEGYKTIAYEIVQQLGDAPDHFVFPVAAGDGLYGPWRGFCELERLELSRTSPRMHGVQAAGANPLVQSFQQGLADVLVHPAPTTIALSIGDATGGRVGLRAIYESGGQAVDVSDEEILSAARFLAGAGVCVEAASAASVAGVWALARLRAIDPEERVVCVLTGAGVKWPPFISALVEQA